MIAVSRDDGVMRCEQLKQRCCEMKHVQCVTDQIQAQCTVPLRVCLIFGLSMAAIDGLRFLRSAYSSSSDLSRYILPPAPLLRGSLFYPPRSLLSSPLARLPHVAGWLGAGEGFLTRTHTHTHTHTHHTHTHTHTHARSPLLTHTHHTHTHTHTHTQAGPHPPGDALFIIAPLQWPVSVHDYSRLPWRAKHRLLIGLRHVYSHSSVSGDFSSCLSLVHTYLHQRCAQLDQATLVKNYREFNSKIP